MYASEDLTLKRRNFSTRRSDLLEELLPRLTMPWLRVPLVEVLANFAPKCGSNRLASQRQNAPSQIEKVEQVKILPGRQ